MDLDLEQQRRAAHSLLDGLPREKLVAVHNLLEVLAETPVSLSQSLANAPVEDEDLSQDAVAALNRASASLEQGQSVTHEEVLREFGQ